MKRAQIDVPCRVTVTGFSGALWSVEPGELLHDIAPYLAHVGSFAVHVSPAGNLEEWVVTNLETGMTVCRPFPWKSQAIASAKRNLARHTPEQIAAAIAANRPEGE